MKGALCDPIYTSLIKSILNLQTCRVCKMYIPSSQGWAFSVLLLCM